MTAQLLRGAIMTLGRCLVEASGNSMLPAIPPGAKVLIEQVAPETVQPGDVIAFMVGETILIHRVISRSVNHFITAGDNCNLHDPPVTLHQLLGRVDQVFSPTDGSFHPVPRAALPDQRIIEDKGPEIHLWWLHEEHEDFNPIQEFATIAGISVTPIRKTAFGVDDSTLADLKENIPKDALRIGLSSSAVHGVSVLANALIESNAPYVHFIVGCEFGYLPHPSVRLLPIDLVNVHAYLPNSLPKALGAAFLLGFVVGRCFEHEVEIPWPRSS